MDRRICVDLGPASPFEGSWMTLGSDCLRVEPQCQLPTFHQSPVVLRPVANLISEGVVAFAHPLAYQEAERWGWSQIPATTPWFVLLYGMIGLPSPVDSLSFHLVQIVRYGHSQTQGSPHKATTQFPLD